MDLTQSSYKLHLGLESPAAFFRREWRAVALFAGAFCVFMLVAIFMIDPAFLYPRIQTDPLNYLLKARSFAETGSTSARWAVNSEPFAYAAMPGVIRAPLLMVFKEFDHQLRAIQVLNVGMVAVTTLLAAYVLSWALPIARHWMAIAFAFGFAMLSPGWFFNVLLPLADAPYALFTLATFIVTVLLICSPEPLSRRGGTVTLAAILFVVSFLLRFTAPVLLAPCWLLGRARWPGALTRRGPRATMAAVASLLILLIALNRQAIFGRYLYEPLSFLRHSEKSGILLNLVGVSIPSQIIPTFQLGFHHPPVTGTFQTTFASGLQDTAWLVVGILITGVVVLGMWKSRTRFLPEIAYVLAPLPVLTLMIQSTTRYLMSYEAFFWMFFYSGAVYVLARLPRNRRIFQSRAAAGVVLVAILTLTLGLRYRKAAGTASETDFAPLTSTPAYIADVSATFRELRSYLESLPADRTLLVGSRGAVGRWKVIAGRDYYNPDSALAKVASERDVFLLVECGAPGACQDADFWRSEMQKRVTKYGKFTFEPVFMSKSRRSRVEVLKVHPAS